MNEIPMIPKSFKPVDIVDNFGDRTMSCGNCKQPIYFPLVRNHKKPTHCKMCGAKIDWSADKKNSLKPGDTIKCHDVDEMIELMQELEKEDIHSDFLYEKDDVKGLWLEIVK